MLKTVSKYEIPEIIYCLTGCSASHTNGSTGDPNREQNPAPCGSGLSKNNRNENKDENYCGYKH